MKVTKKIRLNSIMNYEYFSAFYKYMLRNGYIFSVKKPLYIILTKESALDILRYYQDHIKSRLSFRRSNHFKGYLALKEFCKNEFKLEN